MVELVKHLKGTQDAYNALSGGGGGYSADTLYFTTEFSGDNGLNAGRIYLGGTLVGKPSVWEELPEPLPEFAVDLGLPSGRLWADRNVGAASPESYGDYFMWGSTEPDTDSVCDWAHAPFNGGSSSFDEEYFKANSGTWLNADFTLKPEYDAAHVIMGGSWRMPTSAEMQELLDGTTQTVETLNGVKGMRFTSKSNGNSIFIPLAGIRFGSNVYDMGVYGFAWSSSLSAGNASRSHNLHFSLNGDAIVNNLSRYGGFDVRGVC